jgi:hypothetical protein
MTIDMNIDRAVMIFAGCVIWTGLLLAYFFSPWWLLLPAFAGLNLIQSAFTGFCPPAKLFKKLGLKPGTAFYS